MPVASPVAFSEHRQPETPYICELVLEKTEGGVMKIHMPFKKNTHKKALFNAHYSLKKSLTHVFFFNETGNSVTVNDVQDRTTSQST